MSEYEIKHEGGGFFVVRNKGNKQEYNINLARKTCSCKDYLFRGRVCKHIKMCSGINKEDFPFHNKWFDKVYSDEVR